MLASDIKTILMPTDFSDVGQNALHTTIGICAGQQTELILVHVLEDFHFIAPPKAGVGRPVGSMAHEEAAHKKLFELVVPLIERFNITVRPIVLRGDPAAEICRCAAARHADMIVMGTHGASGLREFFMGSNAYRVVKHATCPVMTVPGNKRWIGFHKILFPVRLIPSALAKYEAIRPLIHQNHSSMVIAGIVKQGDDAGASVMKEIVAIARRKLKYDLVSCTSDVHQTDDIAEYVLHLCHTEEPDLLVITATFERDNIIKNFFIGPYTQQIVNHCKIPVLSIKVEHEVARDFAKADVLSLV